MNIIYQCFQYNNSDLFDYLKLFKEYCATVHYGPTLYVYITRLLANLSISTLMCCFTTYFPVCSCLLENQHLHKQIPIYLSGVISFFCNLIYLIDFANFISAVLDGNTSVKYFRGDI